MSTSCDSLILWHSCPFDCSSLLFFRPLIFSSCSHLSSREKRSLIVVSFFPRVCISPSVASHFILITMSLKMTHLSLFLFLSTFLHIPLIIIIKPRIIIIFFPDPLHALLKLHAFWVTCITNIQDKSFCPVVGRFSGLWDTHFVTQNTTFLSIFFFPFCYPVLPYSQMKIKEQLLVILRQT